jgi:D-arabinose 1-dehydrogenase-like Zn-dependent alcohol dehydrogenase
MKSVIATRPGKLEIVDTPIPTPGPYQALVKTEFACLCNLTDSELLMEKFQGMEDAFPLALGHEAMAEDWVAGPAVEEPAYPPVSASRMPAATAEPMTPATFGPMACMRR